MAGSPRLRSLKRSVFLVSKTSAQANPWNLLPAQLKASVCIFCEPCGKPKKNTKNTNYTRSKKIDLPKVLWAMKGVFHLVSVQVLDLPKTLDFSCGSRKRPTRTLQSNLWQSKSSSKRLGPCGISSWPCGFKCFLLKAMKLCWATKPRTAAPSPICQPKTQCSAWRFRCWTKPSRIGSKQTLKNLFKENTRNATIFKTSTRSYE